MSRYVDNGNGTLTDTQTGLMWQEAYAYPETGSYIDWHTANTYVANLNAEQLGGHADWRLPSRLELQSLYEREYILDFRGKKIVLHIDPIFEFSYGSCFWTSETKGEQALGFDYAQGERDWHAKDSISGTVRAVRLKATRRGGNLL